MAIAYADAGMNKRVYNSAKEFELNLMKEKNIRSLESFKAVREQMGNMDGVLSAHERELYEQQVHRREMYANAAKVAGAVAVGAGAAAAGGLTALGAGLSGESSYMYARNVRDSLMSYDTLASGSSVVKTGANTVKAGAEQGKEIYEKRKAKEDAIALWEP